MCASHRTYLGLATTILMMEAMTMSAAANPATNPTRIADQELFDALDLERPGLVKIHDAVSKGDYSAAARAWADYFRTREQPTLHFSRDTWAEFVRQEFPQLVAPIIAGAEEVVQHRLTNATVTIPVKDGRIVWLHNPTRDSAWIGAVGTPWYLEPVGRAYLLTRDECYAQSFAWFFDQWYDNQDALREHQGGMGFDPLYHAYYPGVRLRIFLDNCYCCAASPALTPEIHVKMLKQTLGSCAWLFAHNRNYRRGNQQVAAVVGLGLAGLFLPEFKDAKRWLELAETRMKEHLKRDFFADGGHKELCTQYHKTCLRDTAFVALTAKANGQPGLFDDPEAGPLLVRSINWLGQLVMPTGETPPLHSAVYSKDWAVYLLMGARHFGRPDFLWLANRVWSRGLVPNQKAPLAHAIYLLNEHMGRSAVPDLLPEKPSGLSVHLEESGFAVMRTGWQEDDRYLVFQHGRANTGHAYPGALHFLLEMNGELIATGPGSPRSYRHPAYRYCYSTRSHNTVSIDLASYPKINGAAPGGRLRTYADLPGAWYVSGSHDGYKKSKDAVVVRQLLVIKDGPIVVSDQVIGGEGGKAYWSFHTPLRLALTDGKKVRLSGRASYVLAPAFPDEIIEAKTEQHWMAVLPGDCQPGDCGAPVHVLRYVKAIMAEGARFRVALFESDGQIEAMSQDALRLTIGDRRFLVLFGDGQTTGETSGVSARAECVCVERSAGRPVRSWVINGVFLAMDGVEWLSCDRPRSVELERPVQ